MTLDKVAEAIRLYEGWLDAEQSPPWGSRSFRNNNPGNIRFSSWSEPGVHGQDDKGFNIYYTSEDGYLALLDLLHRRKAEHPEWTILDLMNSYAPPSENNTSAYAEFVRKCIGADEQTKLNEIS